jgi:hypothetical protein
VRHVGGPPWCVAFPCGAEDQAGPDSTALAEGRRGNPGPQKSLRIDRVTLIWTAIGALVPILGIGIGIDLKDFWWPKEAGTLFMW